METVRKLKANPKLDGHPCHWCQAPLRLGDDAAVCAACQTEHHAMCWDSKAGCANPSCANAPLRQLAVPVNPAAAAANDLAARGLMLCRNCNGTLTLGTPMCPMCRAITSPDGIYHGPKTTVPGATKALVMSIVGIFLCGIILGPLAISTANQAKKTMATDPSYSGEGILTAATVIGVIDIIGWAIAIATRMG
jgi:Prokaryotic RING finger family 1